MISLTCAFTMFLLGICATSSLSITYENDEPAYVDPQNTKLVVLRRNARDIATSIQNIPESVNTMVFNMRNTMNDAVKTSLSSYNELISAIAPECLLNREDEGRALVGTTVTALMQCVERPVASITQSAVAIYETATNATRDANTHIAEVGLCLQADGFVGCVLGVFARTQISIMTSTDSFFKLIMTILEEVTGMEMSMLTCALSSVADGIMQAVRIAATVSVCGLNGAMSGGTAN